MSLTTPSFKLLPKNLQQDGLVAIGGDLDAATLIYAYENGIFPWPQENLPWLWFSPDPRGILNFTNVHISKSLKKFKNKHPQYSMTKNTAFADVIKNCSEQPRPGQMGTWILPELQSAYMDLYRLGYILSIEIWDENKDLIGGIYAVKSSKYYSAESMFYKKSNASKLALWELILELQNQGHTWLDVQMITPVVAQFGATFISKKDFLKKIL